MLEAEVRDLKEILRGITPIAEAKYQYSLERVINTIEQANKLNKAAESNEKKVA